MSPKLVRKCSNDSLERDLEDIGNVLRASYRAERFFIIFTKLLRKNPCDKSCLIMVDAPIHFYSGFHYLLLFIA